MERKHNRLKNFTYEGDYAYFITICCYDNGNYFKDKTLRLLQPRWMMDLLMLLLFGLTSMEILF